jgi:hypothetical protein
MNRVLGFALVGMLAAAPVALEAQQGPRGAERAMRAPGQGGAPLARVLERRSELGLTAEQVGRLETISARLQQQNEPLMAQMRAHRETLRGQRAQARGQRQMPEQLRPVMQQMRENNQAAMQEVRSVLSDEQQTKLRDGMRGQRGERAPGAARGAAGQGGAPLARMLERRAELGLTAEQVSRLEAISERVRQQNEPLMAQVRQHRESMRGQERQPGAERQVPEQVRTAIQQMRQNSQAAMQEAREVLSDDQQTRLREGMRESMQQRRGEGANRRAPRGTR